MKSWHEQWEKSPKAARTDDDGVVHASKLEKRLWADLRFQERYGLITNLQRQVNFPLERGDIKIRTPSGMVAKYRADFVWDENGQQIIADAKGFFDRHSQLKIAVFEALYGVKVKILKAKKTKL
jgi:hypothetical protein